MGAIYETGNDNTGWNARVVKNGSVYNVLVFDADGDIRREHGKKYASDKSAKEYADNIVTRDFRQKRAKNPIGKTKTASLKTITLTHENYNYLARDLHVLAHAPAYQVQTKSGPRWKVKVTAAKAADVKEALKGKPKKTRMQKMGARMRERHPGYADNPQHPIGRYGVRYTVHGGRGTWHALSVTAKLPGALVADLERYRFMLANEQKKDVDSVQVYNVETGAVIAVDRDNVDRHLKNPDTIHIDVNSHNTKGKNVRAKNPAKPGRIESEKDMRMLARQAVARSEADGTSVARNAQGIVEDYRAAGHIIGAMEAAIIAEMAGDYMGAKNAKRRTGRERNPAKKSAHRRIVLVLIGHAQGPGYYTGKGWDTVKSRARIFDSLEGAIAVGDKLAASIPEGMHIEGRRA